jgi:hypothetical protein
MIGWFQVVASQVQARRRQRRPGSMLRPERPRSSAAWLAAGAVCWGLAAAGCAAPAGEKPMTCSQLGGSCSASGTSCCGNLLCVGVNNGFCVAP